MKCLTRVLIVTILQTKFSFLGPKMAGIIHPGGLYIPKAFFEAHLGFKEDLSLAGKPSPSSADAGA
jgi:hypothetical protein